MKTTERNNIIRALFEAMRCDMGVMSEHGDSEKSLLRELCRADADILAAYKETFLD